MANSNKIIKIKGSVKHYDWGGKTFLPQLLNLPNPEQKPFAEYWLGDHLESGYGAVPYLMKVQDVAMMLSIQVHPNKEVAARKFREENEKGLAPDAPDRNYKDANHKPELLSPLGDFYLLHGFKPEKAMEKILDQVPELYFLLPEFANGNYKKLYTTVMELPQNKVNELLQPLIQRIIPCYDRGEFSKDKEDFWAARAAKTFTANGHIDRGIFSVYLFNVVKMSKGQALFQDAGLPHAYLEGHTMEIMANSDNVLRGGLTSKFIDVQELLEQVVYGPTVPHILPGHSSDTPEEVFTTPASDFQLSRIVIATDKAYSLSSAKTDIYFLYKGEVEIISEDLTLKAKAGEAWLVLPGTKIKLQSIRQAVLYRATEP